MSNPNNADEDDCQNATEKDGWECYGMLNKKYKIFADVTSSTGRFHQPTAHGANALSMIYYF